MSSYASKKYEGILTCDDDPGEILRKPCPLMRSDELALAQDTVQKLLHIREHVLGGGAGLAAPQIGISHPIFIYTPDRTAENLRIVINPSYEPLGEESIEGHEACYSVPLRCAKLRRWEKIKVRYNTLEGNIKEDVLEGFAAKVFQHEIDHLKGCLTIDHPTVQVQNFNDAVSFQNYVEQIHLKDAERYRK